MKREQKFPGVYFDTSPPSLTSTKRIKKAIEYFGADHILLGSDTPYGRNNLAININRIQSSDISQDQKALILGGNARRLLKM